jgi:hypothetical protein
MRTLVAVAVLAAGLSTGLCAGCAKNPENPNDMSVRTNGAATMGSLAGRKTYAYQSVAPPPPGDAQWDQAAVAIAEVKSKIDEEMQARGYVLSLTPEVVVRISIGVHEELKEPTGAAASTRIDVPATEETATDLEIDMFDYGNGGHLFHGRAQKLLHHREVDKDQLAKAVRLILEPVPPARTGG